MKIVIDLDEKYYNDIKNSPTASNYSTLYALFGIRNGTPLPKGHGRLIDADEFESSMYHNAFEVNTDLQRWDSGCWIRYKMFENQIINAPTIIEAELKGENK